MTGRRSGMRPATRSLALGGLAPSDEAAWAALAAEAALPNPFYEPGFILPAIRFLQSRHVHLLVVEDRRGWLACVPLSGLRLGQLIPVAFDWPHLYVLLGTPLVRRGFEAEATEAIARFLQQRAAVFVLRDIEEGEILDTLRRAAARYRIGVSEWSTERAIVVRRDAMSYFDDAPRRRLQAIERRRRQLASAVTDLRVRDRGWDAASVEEFLAMERAGWKGRAGTAMDCILTHADFFREICRNFGRDGRLEMLTLESDGATIAMQCNLVAGDELFGFKMAYDERWRRYGPGVMLAYEGIRWFHESRAERRLDTCTHPQDNVVNALTHDRKRLVTLLLARRGAGIAARGGVKAVRLVRHALRNQNGSIVSHHELGRQGSDVRPRRRIDTVA